MVQEPTYDALDRIRAKRETFDDVVSSLLNARVRILELMSVLEGMIAFRKHQGEVLESLTPKEE